MRGKKAKKQKVKETKSKMTKTANEFRKVKGITLIALVVTIIVLLILAGISIAMLTGEGGILQNARDARDKTGRANVIEMAQLDVLNEQTSNQGRITEEKFKDILAKHFNYDLEDELPENLDDLTLSTKDGKYKDIKASEIYNGGFAGETSENETLATKVLKTNPSGDTDYKKSPYVKYNNILCRVLYNDKTHGLQIISVDNMEKKIILGNQDSKALAADFVYNASEKMDNDFRKAAVSYNGAVKRLNDEAKEYILATDKEESTEKKIAIDARSLGSIATLQNGKFQEDITSTEYKDNCKEFVELRFK